MQSTRRLATPNNAWAAAPRFGIRPKDAAAIIEAMAAKTREWRVFFAEKGVPDAECEKIASAFRNPKELGLTQIAKSQAMR